MTCSVNSPANGPGIAAKYFNKGSASCQRHKWPSWSSNISFCVTKHCSGNICEWYAAKCPSNKPFLLDGHDCVAYDSGNLSASAESTTMGYLEPPVGGALITQKHVYNLMESIKGEFSHRRWNLQSSDYNTAIFSTMPLKGSIILDDFFNEVRTAILRIANRTNYEYNFYSGAQDAIVVGETIPTHSVSSSVAPGQIIDDSPYRQLSSLVDSVRRNCICNSNCTGFGVCTCNWDCHCNY